MQTFLQILAVIGIVLLVIIGLILLIIGLALFVPVRYKIKAYKDTETVIQVRITWLLHLLSVRYNYPEPNEIQVRMFGAKIWKMKLGEQEEEQENQQEQAEHLHEPEMVTEREAEGKKVNSSVKEAESKVEKTSDKSEKTESEEIKNSLENDEKSTENIFQKIQYKIKRIYDKIKKILEDYVYYRDLLQEKENRLLFERCKSRILKVLNHIKPKVLKADLLIGTGEPDTTGYVMAIYGILMPVFGYDLNITPDFDRQVFEGRLYIKGRITIFNLLYNGLKIYFDEQLHKLIDNLKRKDV